MVKKSVEYIPDEVKDLLGRAMDSNGWEYRPPYNRFGDFSENFVTSQDGVEIWVDFYSTPLKDDSRINSYSIHISKPHSLEIRGDVAKQAFKELEERYGTRGAPDILTMDHGPLKPPK